MATFGKAHDNTESVTFGPLTALSFDPITLAINQTNATVQAEIPLPCNIKPFYVASLLTGSPAGTCSVQVCAGTAAVAGLGTADTFLTNGQKLLSTAQALTMTADLNQRAQCSVPDAIVNAASTTAGTLTVRTATNGTAAGTLKVTVLGKFVDPNPTKPLYDSNGAFTF